MSAQLLGNRYTLGSKLGAGGMGTVFRSIDTTSNNVVAIKVLKEDSVAQSPEIIERFQREADALRVLNHPNIVKVLDTFEVDEKRYIVMECVEGGSLYDLLKQKKRLSVNQALEISLDLADALTRAHRLKIIHRDLKPGNILLASDGSPRLTDFGIAHMGKKERVTQTGVAIGTPDYLSPEMLNGANVDERADIWAFGVLLYEMLVGKRPFRGDTLTQLLTAILTQPVPDLEIERPDLPIALIDLIYRMLEKDHDSRIPSVRLIGAELENILRTGGKKTTSTSFDNFRLERATPSNNSVFQQSTTMGSAPPNNLPAETTPFVGRENELIELGVLLNEPDVRMITIVGAGGMGKSRLSLQVAHEQLRRFEHGVIAVWLAAISNEEDIVTNIAEALGFTFDGGSRSPLNQILDYLHEKQMLLIMDNFEHVIDSASIVSDILAAAPGVKIIATSRERLNLSGEHVYHLESMDYPETDTTTNADEFSAVQLFLQSARRTRPDFELTEENIPHIARISRMVQGVPLAILLAAAWVESLTVEEIAEEISDSYDFLESELRDLPERHRSIRAVFEYSWNLLSDKERNVFVKFAIFRGGFDRDAGRKITGASLRDLTSLVNKSLLRRDPLSGRYYLHIMLRQYADEALEQNHALRDEINKAHAEYYAKLLHGLEPQFNTTKESTATKTIELELDNIRVAYKWLVENRQWQTIHLMVESMLNFYVARSMLREGVDKFHQLAEAVKTDNMSDPQLFWRARLRELLLSSRGGRYDNVWEGSGEAYEYFYQNNMLVDAITALNNMSYSRMMQGRYDESKHHAGSAIVLAQEINDENGYFTGMGHLGYVEYLQGNYDEALKIYMEIHPDSEQLQHRSPIGKAFGYNNIGEIYMAMSRLNEALDMFRNAHEIFKQGAHRRGTAFTLNNIAGIYTIRGEFQEAEEIFTQAYLLNKEIGDRSGIAHSISALGNIASFKGDFNAAHDYYTQALDIRRQSGELRGVADSLTDLGNIAFALKNMESMIDYYNQALEIRREIGDREGLAKSLAWLGIGEALGYGDTEKANERFNEAYKIAEDVGTQFVINLVTVARGELALGEERFDQARAYFTEALNSSTNAGLKQMQVFAVCGLLTTKINQGMLEEQDYQRSLEVLHSLKHLRKNIINGMIEEQMQFIDDFLRREMPEEDYRAIVDGQPIAFEHTIQQFCDGVI